MGSFSHRHRQEGTPENVCESFFGPGATERELPPWRRAAVIEGPPFGEARSGPITLRARLGLLPVTVELRREEISGELGFADRQVRGPFAELERRVAFRPDPQTGCAIEESVRYALPAALRPFESAIERELARTARFREQRLAFDLARHRDAERASPGPLEVAITGASGLVGTELCALLASGGHRVRRIARASDAAGGSSAERGARAGRRIGRTVVWDPQSGAISRGSLEGLDAVVHLAGRNIAGRRWTARERERIRNSRVHGTERLAHVLAKLERPPRVLVCASAIGFYGGHRGDHLQSETAPVADDFLGRVCADWEAAAAPARAAGIRVVNLRLGLVLSARGGPLGTMLPVFRAGLGGPLGHGEQWMSWIGIEDAIGGFYRAIFDERLRDAVNLTAPAPVRNREFTATLARVLRRPAVLPAPAPAIRVALGERGDALLLGSTRVDCARLRELGFPFCHADLESALRFELGR